MKKNYRIVNLDYIVDGMRFDAAIDCDWQMHDYTTKIFGHEPNSKEVPIELYNLDNPNWDIKMIYFSLSDIDTLNSQQSYISDGLNIPSLLHTWVDLNFILEETKKWIKENEQDRP